jgi:uncharacterized protein
MPSDEPDGLSPVLRVMVDQIVYWAAPQAVVLFGSVSKGTATAGSDIDLLVVQDTHTPPELREADLAALLDEYAFHVDLLVRTPEEVAAGASRSHSFLHSVLRTGRVVYQTPGYQLPDLAV